MRLLCDYCLGSKSKARRAHASPPPTAQLGQWVNGRRHFLIGSSKSLRLTHFANETLVRIVGRTTKVVGVKNCSIGKVRGHAARRGKTTIVVIDCLRGAGINFAGNRLLRGINILLGVLGNEIWARCLSPLNFKIYDGGSSVLLGRKVSGAHADFLKWPANCPRRRRRLFIKPYVRTLGSLVIGFEIYWLANFLLMLHCFADTNFPLNVLLTWKHLS